MSKYEIMLILDPNSTIEKLATLISEVFKDKKPTIEELKNIELAYPINKSKTGKYILVNINADGDEITEFNRKINIQKTIWRMLAINLNTERGLNRKANPKRVKKTFIRRHDRTGHHGTQRDFGIKNTKSDSSLKIDTSTSELKVAKETSQKRGKKIDE